MKIERVVHAIAGPGRGVYRRGGLDVQKKKGPGSGGYSWEWEQLSRVSAAADSLIIQAFATLSKHSYQHRNMRKFIILKRITICSPAGI